jgi:hypothetical protein
MGNEVHRKPWYEESAILALEPESKKTHIVSVSPRAIVAAGKRSMGQAFECAYLLPDVLQFPRHVWRGLRWDDDELFSDSPGWLSYCKIPFCSYSEDGEKQPPRLNRVFMVCVNIDRIVYNWWWVPCDSEDRECPENYKTRFREQLL